MGAPAGHPFFGNQYTTGGYVPGSFKYVAEVSQPLISAATKSVVESASNAQLSAEVAAAVPVGKGVSSLLGRIRSSNPYVLAAVGVAATAVTVVSLGGFLLGRRGEAGEVDEAPGEGLHLSEDPVPEELGDEGARDSFVDG